MTRTSRALLTLGLAVAAVASRARAQGDSSAVGAAQSRQEKATLLHFCQQMDQSSAHTVQGIRDRTDCWKRMQLEGMGDSVVDAGYRAAVADYDAAMKTDSTRLAGDAIEQKLATVQHAILARDLTGARQTVDRVLAAQPDNQRALAFRDRIVALEKTRRVRQVLFGIAGAVLVLAILIAASSRLLVARHRRKLARQTADASQRTGILEIVDGVGRGKVYTITGPIFRIGSAESDRPEEKNDMVLSDAGAFISRYHCAIVRKNGRFFLIDSSLNGTYMDEVLLERGEHRALDDGAEFSLAGMSRVKFLLM